MGRVKSENYYQVCGWMVTELNLKGYELQAFAIIYGFSQDGQSAFAGSVSYLSEWLGTTRQTTTKVLKSLVEKEYLLKEQNEINGVVFNRYKANLFAVKNFTGCQKSLHGGKELLRGCKENLQGVSKNLTGGCQKSLQGGVKKFDTIINNNTNSVDNNSITTTTTTTDTIDGGADDGVAKEIFELWDNYISPLNQYYAEQLQALIEECGDKAVKAGVEAALNNNVRKLSYVQAVARKIASGEQAPKQRTSDSRSAMQAAFEELYGGENSDA